MNHLEAQPMNLNHSVHTWGNILLHPKQSTFQNELEASAPDLWTTFLWFILALIITTSMNAILTYSSLIHERNIGIYFSPGFQEVANSTILDTIVWSVVKGLLYYLLLIGLSFGSAKLFGSSRDFTHHAYLLTSFIAPLWVSVIWLLPWWVS